MMRATFDLWQGVIIITIIIIIYFHLLPEVEPALRLQLLQGGRGLLQAPVQLAVSHQQPAGHT